MHKRNSLLYIMDIKDSIDKSIAYTDSMTYNEFLKSDMAKDAVVRNIEIIGEAATQLDSAYKKKHPSVPWVEMKSMRNKIIHEYFGVDYDIVWKTARVALPKLRQQIQAIIDESG